VLACRLAFSVRKKFCYVDVSIKRLRWEKSLVLLLGAGFELLGLGGAGTVLVEASQELALADRLQIQITVVVLAENVWAPYCLPLLLYS
jgi:hypothetical protein